jgi:hypothetical protein
MNIWRIAGTVAAFCAVTVVAFYVSSGKMESWNFHDFLGMIGSASFAALFTFTIVLFPYYWLKMMLGFFSFWYRGNIQNKSQKPNNDILGILVSFILVIVTLWLGKTYF